MALWLIKQGIDVRVVAIAQLKDGDRVYLQPPGGHPAPRRAEGWRLGWVLEDTWLIDGESWHLEHRCSEEGRAILERAIAIIGEEIPEAEGPSWSQKLYISWSAEGRGWAFLHSGAKRAVLDLKKSPLDPTQAAERLSYHVFDEEAELKDKLALGSSVAGHHDGLRITIKSEDDLYGEKGQALATLPRDSWAAMTGA